MEKPTETEGTRVKFSIIITTHNRVALLKKAIDSALKQTIPCEVVVADDASSDETEDYVRNLSAALIQQGDHRLVYHRNLSNLGHSATMNAGVNVASGDWIKPLDDDDYLAPDCIEEMIKAINIYENKNLISKVVILSCQASQVSFDDKEISRTKFIDEGEAFYVPQKDIHYGMLLEQISFGTTSQIAFRRDAFIESGGWDSRFDTNFDDVDSCIKISQFGDAIFINKCLAYRKIWHGAYNYKIPFRKRMETHILIKGKIYNMLDKDRDYLPSLQDILSHLRLHWGIAAIRRGEVLEGLSLISGAVFSLLAWELWLFSIVTQKRRFSKLKPLFRLNNILEFSIKRIILV